MSRYILLQSYKFESSNSRSISVHLNSMHGGKWSNISRNIDITVNNVRSMSSSLKKNDDERNTSKNDDNYKSNGRKNVTPSAELKRKEDQPIDNVVSSASSSLMKSLPVSVQPYAQLARLDKV